MRHHVDRQQLVSAMYLTLPTLIIAGRHDVASPLSKSEFLLSQYENARLIILDAGHLSNIEQAEQFNEELIAFLSS